MSDEEDEHLDRSEQLLTEVPGARVSDDRADAVFDEAWEEASEETSDAPEADRRETPPPARDERGDDDHAEVVEIDQEPSESGRGGGDDGSRLRRWAVAAAVLLSVGAVWWVAPWQTTTDTPTETTDGFKSPDGAPEVELIALTARLESGKPVVGSRLSSGASLEPGHRILFRYRLSRSTHVALLEQPKGRGVHVLWRSDGAADAHETEIQSDGRALALDPSKYDDSFRLALVAGEQSQLDALSSTDELTKSSIRRACSECGFDVLRLEAPTQK